MRSTQRMAVLHAIFRLRAGTAIAIAVARAAVAIVGVAQLTSEDCLNVFHLSFAEKIVYHLSESCFILTSSLAALANHLLGPLYRFNPLHLLSFLCCVVVLDWLKHSWKNDIGKFTILIISKAKSAAIAADDDGEVEAPPDESESCKAWNSEAVDLGQLRCEVGGCFFKVTTAVEQSGYIFCKVLECNSDCVTKRLMPKLH